MSYFITIRKSFQVPYKFHVNKKESHEILVTL